MSRLCIVSWGGSHKVCCRFSSGSRRSQGATLLGRDNDKACARWTNLHSVNRMSRRSIALPWLLYEGLTPLDSKAFPDAPRITFLRCCGRIRIGGWSGTVQATTPLWGHTLGWSVGDVSSLKALSTAVTSQSSARIQKARNQLTFFIDILWKKPR